MATPTEIRALSDALAGIAKEVGNCKSITLAYVEAEEAWWNAQVPTDYQRARDVAVAAMGGARVRIQQLRQGGLLSPHIVRADFQLLRLIICCQRCPDINRDAGKAFACVVEQELDKGSAVLPRFRLDEQGQILERE